MSSLRPELHGTFGMVASTHWLASAAGMATLEQGGNAFDAAVAAGFVLQVVEPHMNGPGGEVPILAHSAERGRVVVINGQGPAPAGATIEEFEALGLPLVPGTGLLPACVPGAFDAWMIALRDYGTLHLRDVLRYAVGYAHSGWPVTSAVSETIGQVDDLFRQEWTDSAAVYLPGGRVPAPGTLLENPALAATYARIVRRAERRTADRRDQIDAARALFYKGFVAQRIHDHCTGAEVLDSTGRRHRGLLRYVDLDGFEARVEGPETLDFKGLTVCKTGPWGQGPVLLQQLALLDGFDLEAMGAGSAELVHTVMECSKLAFADREAWYGDPAFGDVPLDLLLSAPYADERRRLVDERASFELRPGDARGRSAVLPPAVTPEITALSGPGVGEPTLAVEPAGDTCHLDVADRFGNLVSATPSGGWLQSSPVIGDLGFPLGTRGQMFWLVPELPNSLAPGKRPRTTLSPSLVLRGGEPYLSFGTPGGDQQDQWTLNFFINHVVFGMDLQAAIDAPQWHTEHFPSSFYPRTSRPGTLFLERRHEPAVVAELRDRGHEIHVEPDWSLGRVTAAARGPDGTLRASADPRGGHAYVIGR